MTFDKKTLEVTRKEKMKISVQETVKYSIPGVIITGLGKGLCFYAGLLTDNAIDKTVTSIPLINKETYQPSIIGDTYLNNYLGNTILCAGLAASIIIGYIWSRGRVKERIEHKKTDKKLDYIITQLDEMNKKNYEV